MKAKSSAGAPGSVDWVPLTQRPNLLANVSDHLRVGPIVQDAIYPVPDGLEFRHGKAMRCSGIAGEPQTRRRLGGMGIEGDLVLVDGKPGTLKGRRCHIAGGTSFRQDGQHQTGVGPARNHADPGLGQNTRQRPRVIEDRLIIALELGAKRFSEASV